MGNQVLHLALSYLPWEKNLPFSLPMAHPISQNIFYTNLLRTNKKAAHHIGFAGFGRWQICQRTLFIKTIANLSINGPLANSNDPMDIKALSAYIKTSPSAIYKFTSEGSIPPYKKGKRPYFKREEINDWIFTTKLNTPYDIDKAAKDYIRKHPSRSYLLFFLSK